ncbi:hypothetical protein ACA097_04155 [Pseudomonas sp. QL9]|uniref:hypothetical protein n=1 Tax=Pseudomonas sp. QL9 TaxID=3242725 RepID=UPI00352A6D6B
MIHERVIGCSTTLEENNTYYTDIGQILRRLLIFEEYTIKSIRLREFEALSNTLGIEKTLELIKESPLKIIADPTTFAQTGQAAILDKRIRSGVLPLGSYSLSVLSVPDKRDYISGCFSESTSRINAHKNKVKKLKLEIAKKIIHPDIEISTESLKQTHLDLNSQSPTLNYLIERNLKSLHNITPSHGEIKTSITQIDNEDFRIETNIGRSTGLDMQNEHKLVEKAVLELAGLNKVLSEMNHFEAMSGFKESDIEALQSKLSFLLKKLNPKAQEERFTRVIEILDLPDFSDLEYGCTIDVDKFIEARNSADCREFREWLRKSENLSEKEIRDAVNGLRAKISNFTTSKTGRSLRFIATTAVGQVPAVGTLASTCIGAIDSFILDKIFKKKSFSTFIGKTYPNLFKDY